MSYHRPAVYCGPVGIPSALRRLLDDWLIITRSTPRILPHVIIRRMRMRLGSLPRLLFMDDGERMKRPSIQGRWTGRAARRLWRTTGTWTAVACGCWSAVTAEPIHWHSAPPQSFQHLIPFLGLRLADNTAAADARPDSSSHGWQLLPPDSHEMRSQEQTFRGAGDGGTTGIADTAPESHRYSFDAPLDLPLNTEPEYPAGEPSPSATDAPSEERIDEMPALPGTFGFP